MKGGDTVRSGCSLGPEIVGQGVEVLHHSRREPGGNLRVLSSSSGHSTPVNSYGAVIQTTPTFARPRRDPPLMVPCVHKAR